MNTRSVLFAIVLAQGLLVKAAISEEAPALPDNLISQSNIESGTLTLKQIRNAGKLVFTTPYNRFDGLGDGPLDPARPYTEMGNRVSLQNPFSPFLRVNGLDAQTCLECHSVLSRAEIPMTFAVGGHGGLNSNPIFMPDEIDVDDSEHHVHFAFTNGRFINPPFLFGAGGVELVGKEMTAELQEIKAEVEAAPAGTTLDLVAKGVFFGTATSNGDGTAALEIDGDGLAIDKDLVVRPFGRKGEFPTIRSFDVGAMLFHFGLQAVELFGEYVDDDGDGIVNEVTVGELSALSTFLASMPRPFLEAKGEFARQGADLFREVGCSDCHVRAMQTEKRILTQSFPEILTEPGANSYLSMDLAKAPMRFKTNRRGGITVRMFSDLKRHNMGPELAESTGSELDPYFITARLWGIADSAPYLHDGRATTLTEAIVAHGGEAEEASINFQNLREHEKEQILSFLRSLRVPRPMAINVLVRPKYLP